MKKIGELNAKNKRIMRYIPKSKIDAIQDAYTEDENGYWIILDKHWNADHMDQDCRTIHEYTIKDLRYQISGIRKLTDEEYITMKREYDD